MVQTSWYINELIVQTVDSLVSMPKHGHGHSETSWYINELIVQTVDTVLSPCPNMDTDTVRPHGTLMN